ncbi:hypothetical protein GCM10011519_27960 [Marmoricola endophyticus]|uniref:ER-bound oxygenase mpaB/mpaB'/Rubber oxygenase catalytic domain-containing protein n=2 Tax=Marmoricola endophyticus TaxID=2040280 RepID=A0A917F5Q4_9ACTN|nr:hypothetical protein GCM10011519_27960 [Marmoricola endophyticus]
MIATPAADHGFFGPGSVTWRVWSHPVSVNVGFMRSVVIQHLDPFLAASVDASGQVEARTALRYDRTMEYFAQVAFGDAETALRMSEILVRIHSRAVGTEPVTGRPFDANDPDSQLWIHVTAWHSILYCYEVFGPGRLSAIDEAAYWQQCAIAAELQTIDPRDVPRTRAGVRAYFEDYRPRLVTTEPALRLMDFLLDLQSHLLPQVLPGPLPRIGNALVRHATIATMPRWMRPLVGVEQSPAVDAAAIAATRTAMSALKRDPRRMLEVLDRLTPRTTPILAPALMGTPSANPVTYTPTEARRVFGHEQTPREMYDDILAARRAGEGPAPYTHGHTDELLSFTG